MWPWEHLAFAYLLYSPAVRARGGSPPGGAAVLALAVGTQFPDVVDKPLAWGLGVVPVLTHALAVAVPLVAAGVLLARRRGRTELGVAFGVGYLSHLAGDVLYPLLTGGPPGGAFLLWPFVDLPAAGRPGLVASVAYYFRRYVAFLSTPYGRAYAAVEVVFLVAAALAWVRDGAPGVGELRATVARVGSG